MTRDDTPKSAIDIVMERLRQRDRDAGVSTTDLSEHQRAGIAEARQMAEARLAELKILHGSKIAVVADPAEHERLEDEYRQQIARITDERDRKIARIRGGDQ